MTIMNCSAELTLNRRRGVTRGIEADPPRCLLFDGMRGVSHFVWGVQPPDPLANTALLSRIFNDTKQRSACLRQLSFL